MLGPHINPVQERFVRPPRGLYPLITQATCEQVFDALLPGLDPEEMTLLLMRIGKKDSTT